MIDIRNIQSGWLDLQIGNREFCVSYLTEVKDEINKLFEDRTTKVLYFDGEGAELCLTIRYEYNNIIILWEECTHYGAYNLDRLEFNIDEFKEAWLVLWNKIQDNYNKNFTLNRE
jgi:hypothetical protein